MDLRFILNLGHGLLPRQRVGDFDHHLHTMATSLDFAELSALPENADLLGSL
jgi:hypothetical protein